MTRRSPTGCSAAPPPGVLTDESLDEKKNEQLEGRKAARTAVPRWGRHWPSVELAKAEHEDFFFFIIPSYFRRLSLTQSVPPLEGPLIVSCSAFPFHRKTNQYTEGLLKQTSVSLTWPAGQGRKMPKEKICTPDAHLLHVSTNVTLCWSNNSQKWWGPRDFSQCSRHYSVTHYTTSTNDCLHFSPELATCVFVSQVISGSLALLFVTSKQTQNMTQMNLT